MSWAISLHSGDVQELYNHCGTVTPCFHVGLLVVRPDPDPCLHCRPLSKEEVASGVQQVITCNERAREVVVSQSMGGKTLGRSFHFDKVGTADVYLHLIGTARMLRPKTHQTSRHFESDLQAPRACSCKGRDVPLDIFMTEKHIFCRYLTQRQVRQRSTRWPLHQSWKRCLRASIARYLPMARPALGRPTPWRSAHFLTITAQAACLHTSGLVLADATRVSRTVTASWVDLLRFHGIKSLATF